MITEGIFYLFSGLAVMSALYLLLTKNVLHAALALVATLLLIAGIYVFANAEFVAVTQIMIYVGGIVVLIIFGVMLTHDVSRDKIGIGTGNKFLGAIFTLVLFYLLTYGIKDLVFQDARYEDITMKVLGKELMTTYMLPFEVAAVLLLVALVAAAIVASRHFNFQDKDD